MSTDMLWKALNSRFWDTNDNKERDLIDALMVHMESRLTKKQEVVDDGV